MTPRRLNEDQRLLYDCLASIWLVQSRKIVLVVAIALSVGFGLTVGVLLGTRQTLRQTGRIAAGLRLQVEGNRMMIETMAREHALQQQRYVNLLAAFESVKRQARRKR